MKADDKKETEAGGIVVFSILKPSACAECGTELWKGSFLRMEKAKPLCLECADLDHLVFLPRGDGANAPEPEVFDPVRGGREVQPFPQKVRASRLARGIRRA
jgi:hypothetical protein